MNINKFFQTNAFKGIASSIVILIILLLVFKAGMIVGIKKADFSYRWSDNYHKNFGGPKNGFFRGFGDRDFLDANGTFGQIIKMENGTLAIKSNNNAEKIIIINGSTTIKRFQETIQTSDLKIGDNVVVVGEPNSSGQIVAQLIRIMPAPSASPAPGQMKRFPQAPY